MASTPADSITAVPEQLIGLATDSVTAVGLSRSQLLNRLEAAVRGVAKYQNARGAIIDPIEGREVQYSTPYYAYAASSLIAAGRATDLLASATNAMTHATASYAGGLNNIPDQHGEFYLFPMAKAYKNLAGLARNSLARTWLTRMQTPLSETLQGLDWNWTTYAMKGAWALYGVGALSRASAVNFIESSWNDTQSARITNNALRLYEDNTSDPDTIAYDYAARANLMYLVTAGYDGASAGAIRTDVMRGNTSGLYLIDPTGQVGNTGRSANHVWNDLVAAVGFERQARVLANQGFADTAAKFHRAASLAVESVDRWQRSDGLYYVTKNRFSFTDKRGYADYSGLTNYNGYMMLHMAELAEEWRPGLGEQALPSETGGYALQTDSDYATAVADAGGVHINAALRGQTAINYEQFWTQLGVTRVSEAGWDSRLGNLSGQDPKTKAAFSLAPAVFIGGAWKRLAELPTVYTGTFTVETETAELTRVSITYKPRASASSQYPTLVQTMTITRDGVLMTVSGTAANVGVTLPLLVSDGAALATSISTGRASTAYSARGDSLNYLLATRGSSIADTGAVIRGATGDYKPLLATRAGGSMSVFIYTQKAGETNAAAVQRTLAVNKYNYSSALGRVSGRIYVGASGIAGGYGSTVDLDGDGATDVRFSSPVEWVLSLRRGVPRYAEVDDAVTYYHGDIEYGLSAYATRRVR